MQSPSPFTLGDTFVIVGAIITALAYLYLYWKQQRDETDRLRRAIVAELVNVGDSVYEEIEALDPTSERVEIPDDSPVVTTVFENNAGELGRLSATETELVTTYYTTAVSVHRKLTRLSGSDSVSPEQVLYLRRDLVELNNLRNDALDELGRSFVSWWHVHDEFLPVEPLHRERLDRSEVSLDDYRTATRNDTGSGMGDQPVWIRLYRTLIECLRALLRPN